jgi:drug/metabolite transporter (DMT)-like permease
VLAGAIHLTPAGAALAVASGAITSGLGYVAWYSALPHLTAARAAVLQLSVPVIAAAGGVLLLGEVLTARLLISGAAVLVGIALASRKSRPASESQPARAA